MVRQKSRKTVEELYAVAPPPLAPTRFDEHFYQNSKNTRCNKVATDKADHCNNTLTCRKKSKGPISTIGAEMKDEKTFINEEKLMGKGTKAKKPELFTMPNLDNRNQMNFAQDNEKDEDTEEFFELIKETVENAVVKTLSDILNRNFRDVSAKIDELGDQLRGNDAKLEKVQADLNNKIAHYGEENSRHFRYLCMKSEYDKMFYQHQNIMTTMPVDSRPNVIHPYAQQFAAPGQPVPQSQVPVVKMPPQQTKVQDCVSQCNCQSQGSGDFGTVKHSKSIISSKSSEMGIKEVKELLEQLQKFYENQQSEGDGGKEGRRDTRGVLALNIPDDSFDGDEDDDSSDALSSASIEEKLGAGGDS